MKKRFYFLFIFLVLLTSVIIWRKPLTFHAACFGFKYFSEKSLGEKVSFHDFRLENRQIILLEPKIGSKNKANERGGVFLEADSAQIKYEIDWLSREIKVGLKLKNPKVQIIKTPTFQPSLKGFFSQKEAFFHLQTTLEVEGGELELVDKISKVDSSIQTIQFDTQTEVISPSQMVFVVNLEQGESKCRSFVSLKEKIIDYKLDLEKIKVSEMQDAIYFFASSKLKEERSLSFSEGTLSGTFDLLMHPDTLPVFQTYLELNKLHLNDKKTFLSTIIPKAEISLKTATSLKEKEDYTIREVFETLIEKSSGCIDIPNGAEILYSKNQLGILKSPNMKGQIVLKEKDPIKLHLEGNVLTGNHKSHLSVDGAGSLTLLKGDLEITMKSDFKEEAKVRLSLDPYGSNQHKLYSQILNFSHTETDFVQQLLMPFYPEIKSIEMQKGILDASFQCTFKENRLEHLAVDDFNLKGGYLTNLNWIENIENMDAGGAFNLNFFNRNPLESISGDIKFTIEKLLTSKVSFDHLKGQCQFSNGKVETGTANAYFSNIRSKLDWDLKNIDRPLTITMESLGKDFIQFAPPTLIETYGPIFNDELLDVKLTGKIYDHELKLSGLCKVAENEPAHFGFTLFKKRKNEENQEAFKLFWENFITPLKITPALSYFERDLSLYLNPTLSVKDGWFEIQKVAIEKFVSPILFGNTSIEFKGVSDIAGKFDQGGLSLSYNNYQLSFDHQHFSIDLDSVKNLSKPGYHYFNFSKNTHFGRVFVQDASCVVKSVGLSFDQLSGWIEITPDRIFAENLDAKIFDLDLNSQLNLSFLGGGDLDLMLKICKFKGELSNFKTLISSMEKSFLNNLPLDGILEIDPKNAFFHLLKKEEVKTRLALSGSLTNGRAPFMGQQPLTQISCKFAYDSDTQVFELKDFESMWKSHKNQDYGLFSNYLKINLFEDEPCLFDIKIKNSYKDCARILGKLYLNLAQKKPILKIILDQKDNHVGSIALTNVYFALNEFFKLDYLNVNFSCNLNSLNHDISLVQNLLPQTSGSALTALKWMDLNGDLSGQWTYDLNQEQHQCFLWGDQIKIGGTRGGFFQLKGTKKKNSFLVEDFTYQQIKGSCKLEERPLCFFIRDFKLISGHDFALDLSGIYCKIFNSFQADIGRLYCNLNTLKEADLFSELSFLKNSFGELDLKGKLEGGFFKGDINYGLEVAGNTIGLKLHDILFQDDKIKCSFKGNSKQFKVEHFESRFLEAFQKPINASFIGDNLEFGGGSTLNKIGNIEFAVNANNLQSVQSILKEKWHLDIPQSSFEIKKEGILKGSVSFDPNDTRYPFTLKLQEGDYSILNQIYLLNQCKLKYGPSGLKIAVKVPINDQPYWLSYKKESFKQDVFALSLYDQDPVSKKVPHLKVECLEKPSGLMIKNIRGTVAGLRFDFVHRPEKDTKEANVLMGQLQIQGNDLIQKLPWEIASKLEKFSFGKGYFLTGQLTLPKDNIKDFVFDGLFGGQDFDLLGFEFKSLASIISCSLNQFLIKDLKISDLSGELLIDKIEVLKNNLGYELSIPTIKLKEFKPSLLHRSNQGRVKHKPLIIEEVEINQLKGNLSDINTLSGEGFFTFQKTPKKQASLLDIPVHLISKLGLDLTMLNPVEGKVVFKIKDQKIILTKLVDVYSHDKHCHFTLAKQPHVSYMDFDGNLNVKIKMKQYVLLKITEPFMISVQGHYLAPRYSFMRKKVIVDVPERSPDEASL